jgi:hypothetical protein
MSVKKSFSVPPWRRSSPWITRWSGWRARDWAFLERALHGNPLDGHTLDTAIKDIETNTGIEVKRAPLNNHVGRFFMDD